jgi:DNA-binding response OmpR family regulator
VEGGTFFAAKDSGRLGPAACARPAFRKRLQTEHVNILLVEDHADTRRVLSTLLGRSGHEIITATGVADALQLLANMRVNVLLSDLGLPDGDGLDLVARAKSLQPKIKTIALTARGSQKDYELGKKAGFDHYLTKPFDFHELRTLLNLVRKSAA